MAEDHDKGPFEKAKDKVADSITPTDEELRQAGHKGPGGSAGESEAAEQAPTSS